MAFGSSLYNLYRYGSTRAPTGPMVFQRGAGITDQYTPAPNTTLAPRGTFPIGPSSRPAATSTVKTRTGNVIPPPPTVSTPRPGGTTQTGPLTSTQRAAPVGPDLEELQQIEEMYGGTSGFLNTLQSNIESDLGRTLDVTGGQFEAQRPFLEQAKGEALTQNTAQQEAEGRQRENAMAEARLLYSELGQAGRQRFGGTSSAGEFASAIQGRELQRSQGKITQTSAANLTALRNKATSIQQNYTNQLQQLEAQKSAALNDVRNQFNQRLAQIDASRTENDAAKAADKAADKLDALREARSRAEEIENQKTQFQQNIDSQTLAAAQNIYAAIQSYRAQMGEPVDLQGLPGAQFSTIGGLQGTAEQALPQGYFKRPDTSEEYLPQGLFAEGLPPL